MPANLTVHTLAIKLMNAMNSRDLQEFEALLAESAVFDFPGPGKIEGRKRIITFLRVLFRRFPSLSFQVHNIVAHDDQACVIWSNTGENSSGMLYSNQGITHIQVKNAVIVWMSDYFKDTSFVAKDR